MWLIVLVLMAPILFLTGRFFLSNNWLSGWQIIGETLGGSVFWSAVTVGFLAQIVDGALGMAYGVATITFLLATGASPGTASASVHIAEIFTTGVSGLSHAKFGNVNKQLFVRLLTDTGPIIVGLVFGGLFAAPFAAVLCKKLHARTLLILVGTLIIITSLYNLSRAIAV